MPHPHCRSRRYLSLIALVVVVVSAVMPARAATPLSGPLRFQITLSKKLAARAGAQARRPEAACSC